MKLNDTNYHERNLLIEVLLTRKGLWEYVDGTKTMPLGSPNLKSVKHFLKKQAEARAEIILHVEPSQLLHVRNRDPSAIWADLETVHHARGFTTHITLRRKFLML